MLVTMSARNVHNLEDPGVVTDFRCRVLHRHDGYLSRYRPNHGWGGHGLYELLENRLPKFDRRIVLPLSVVEVEIEIRSNDLETCIPDQKSFSYLSIYLRHP